MKKTQVALLYGGRSAEHEISLQSAVSVAQNLDLSRFEPVLVGIDKEGRWWSGNVQKITQTPSSLALPNSSRVILSMQENQKAGGLLALTMQNPTPSSTAIDVVFPILHGPMGEDGTVQGLLELAGLPYVSCGVMASAIAMDKDIAKRIIRQAGIPVGPYLTLKQGLWQKDQKNCLSQIAQTLPLPVFIKPANLGSSVGIQKVKIFQELAKAIEDAFQYDTKILIEKAINAREIEVAVLEDLQYGEKPLVSIPGEIIPRHEFYSYEAKYLDENGALLEIPALLTETQKQNAKAIAINVFEALECEGMARVDLFLDKDTGEFFFNEANTIPGFTSISMYPKLWEASGRCYKDLLSHLIDLALARHARRSKLKS